MDIFLIISIISFLLSGIGCGAMFFPPDHIERTWRIRIGYGLILITIFSSIFISINYRNYKTVPVVKSLTAEEIENRRRDFVWNELFSDFKAINDGTLKMTRQQQLNAAENYINLELIKRGEKWQYNSKLRTYVPKLNLTPAELYNQGVSVKKDVICNMHDGLSQDDANKIDEWRDSVYFKIQSQDAKYFIDGDSMQALYNEKVKTLNSDPCSQASMLANHYDDCSCCVIFKDLEYLSKLENVKIVEDTHR